MTGSRVDIDSFVLSPWSPHLTHPTIRLTNATLEQAAVTTDTVVLKIDVRSNFCKFE